MMKKKCVFWITFEKGRGDFSEDEENVSALKRGHLGEGLRFGERQKVVKMRSE